MIITLTINNTVIIIVTLIVLILITIIILIIIISITKSGIITITDLAITMIITITVTMTGSHEQRSLFAFPNSPPALHRDTRNTFIIIIIIIKIDRCDY